MSYNSLKSSENNTNLMHPVDARLRHISQTILPQTPYLLTIPSDYRMSPQHINDWRRGSPFAAHEERLQYLAFLNHQNEDTMFRVIGDWDDGHGNIKPPQEKRSGTNSPLPGQPAKKKISLLDYKNKASGQSAAKPSTQKVDHEPPKPPEDLKMSQPPTAEQAATAQEEPQSLKRPIDAVENSNGAESQILRPESPPTKKARKSPKEPQTSEKHAVFTLPPLLSPNLPAVIEDELFKLKQSKEDPATGKGASNAATIPTKKASSDQLSQIEKPKSAKPPEKSVVTPAKASERKVVKESPREIKEPKYAPANGVKAAVSNGVTKAQSKPKENTSNTDKERISNLTYGAVNSKSGPKRPSLVLKLRIPKAIRKNCLRILNMKPRQQKSVDQLMKRTPSNRSLGDEPDPKIADATALASKSAEKRRRQEDEASAIAEPANKRAKHPDRLDLSSKPRTPLRPPIISPVLSQHSSAQKSHLATPKRDLKGSTMRRIGSSEGDVTTPLGAARGSTPTASTTSDRNNREARATSSASSVDVSNRDKVAVLKAEQGKFAALGRKLKHEAQALIPTETQAKIDSPTTKQGAALAFEALLSFMLSFALKDEISRAYGPSFDPTAWRSLLGYINFVKMATQLYLPLRGLVHQLEGVCRDTIAVCDTYRFDGDPFLKSLQENETTTRPSTAASTSNGNVPSPPSAEEKSKLKKDFLDFRTEHARNVREAQLTWQIGYAKLPVRELQRTFPDSWAKSAEVPGLGKSKDEVTPGRYMEAGYYLPLGPATACPEAVRAGWTMLEEWCGRENVSWEGKMGL
ncbi:MAG: hypothetical protein Q9191_000855 [Dirinaria sp. TL-2023a]